jgi:hypothetical protein
VNFLIGLDDEAMKKDFMKEGALELSTEGQIGC